MTDIVENIEYKKLLESIKEKVYKAQYEALKKVNKEHIALCWYIGEKIVEKQQLHNWGKSVVENLSKDLQKEFPGIQGFSMRNLWNMRSFFVAYKDNKKMQPLVAEISCFGAGRDREKVSRANSFSGIKKTRDRGRG
ncbi:MAG: DUF1016 N-terminal domain-containing protein [Candidatus Moranbacteria bacterium]|nr:DUF1016 N-terminal domain-containing protein [Candidatus Moranbacteria bacterium]